MDGSGFGGFRIGRILGIPMRVSWLALLMIAALTVTYTQQIGTLESVDLTGAGRAALAAALAIAAYCCILLHEIGHSLTARAFGVPVTEIRLDAFIGLSVLGREPSTPGSSFAISAAGPAVNVVIAAAGLGAGELLPSGAGGFFVATLGFLNALLAILNLLPGAPLDGGEMLSAAIWAVSGSKRRGRLIAARAGQVVAVIIIVVPILLAARGSFSQSLAGFVIFWIVGAMIWRSASGEIKFLALERALASVTVRGLVRPAAPVPAGATLGQALAVATDWPHTPIVTVDPASGQASGLLDPVAVAAVPASARATIAVANLARSIDPGAVLPIGLGGIALYQRLAETPTDQFLVVDQRGAVVGVLLAGDVPEPGESTR